MQGILFGRAGYTVPVENYSGEKDRIVNTRIVKDRSLHQSVVFLNTISDIHCISSI